MITLQEFSDTLLFWLYDLPDILIAESASMEVVIDVRQQEIFRETLYADENGQVVLRNLNDLLSPYFDGDGSIDVSINTHLAYVYYSRRSLPFADLDDYPLGEYPRLLSITTDLFADFNISVPLSFLLGGLASLIFSLDLYGLDNNGFLYCETQSLRMENSSIIPAMESVTLTPAALFVSDRMKLLKPYGIVVRHDNRILAKIAFVQDENRMTLRWVNNFNCVQTLCLPGTYEYAPDYDRVIGSIFGAKRTINAKETINYSFYCGPVGVSAFSQIIDAASSNDCWMTIGRDSFEITMESPDATLKGDKYEFYTPKLKFSRSKNPAALIIDNDGTH